MKDILTRVYTIVVYFALIAGVTLIASWILNMEYKEAFLPVAISVIVIDIVSFQYRVQKLESDTKQLVKQAESKFHDQLQFEVNSRVIGDNLHSINKGLDKIRLMELEHKLREMKK